MRRFHTLVVVAYSLLLAMAQENRRMADIRGQSFGLENFLMQPFNLAAQAERDLVPPKRRDRIHLVDPYSVDYDVQSENFDVRKISKTPSRIPPLFDSQEHPGQGMKPVHEYPESGPPKRRFYIEDGNRQPLDQTLKRRVLGAETRRPLERPTEFQLTLSDEPPQQPLPPAERPRKRVMKRRRKKPTTPQPEIVSEEETIFSPEVPKQEPTEELHFSLFTENTKPETFTYADVLRPQSNIRSRPVNQRDSYKTFNQETDLSGPEQRPSRRPQQTSNKRQREPIKEEVSAKPISEVGVIDLPPKELQFDELTINNPLKSNQESDQFGPEQRPSRRPQSTSAKRQREPIKEVVSVKPDEEVSVIHKPPNDQLIEEPTTNYDKRDNTDIKLNVAEIINKDPITPIAPTTEVPQQPTNRLKTLLKQQNGQVSLSELLQTQNLSLSDFLKGNPGALSALGAKKINSDDPTTPQPDLTGEKPKYQSSRPLIPKISSKSRPFSKASNSTNTKPTRRPIEEREQQKNLPKKLDIIEVTSDRPTYNGFTPKNPRTKPPIYRGDYKAAYSRDKIEEQASESLKSIIKAITEDGSEEQKNTEKPVKSTSRIPVFKPSILSSKESNSGEQRVVPPKRFGEYHPKLRIDRRKPTTDGTTEGITTAESIDTTKIVTTEEVKTTTEPKFKVRIPFMSVNNPEISVILPHKKNTTTERPKDIPRFPMRDRINLFKRLNQEEKQNEITDAQRTESTEEPTTQPHTTETATTMRHEEKTVNPTTNRTTTEQASTIKLDDDLRVETSDDEIVELLKMGNNAQRLQRILETRNMTINELLEKRARSSKHPNVTFLFENQTESQINTKTNVNELSDNFHPTPSKTTTKVPLAVFPEFPKFKSDPEDKVIVGKPIQLHRSHHESNSFDELFVDESVIRPIKIPFDSDDKRESKAYETKGGTDNKHIKNGAKLHINLSPSTDVSPKHPMPIWNVDEKSIYNSNPYGYPTYDLNKNLAGYNPTTINTPESTVNERENLVLESVRRTQDANLKLKHNINEILKEQVEIEKEIDAEEKNFIPPAVKSAIIASGVVMGIALLVFIAIFAACGWKQRQFRLRARSSILNDSLNGTGPKMIKANNTLSPISFKRTPLYKKSIEFEDSDSSISTSSNTSSYLWNTLKHTFQSRNSTLKNRQEKEEKMQERENRSRRNTLTRDDDKSRRIREDGHRDSFITTDLGRRNTLTRDEHHRDSFAAGDLPRRNTLTRDEMRRDSVMSRDTLSRDDTRRSSLFRDDTRRLNSLLRENERCSFKKIDPDRNIIQTSVNFKRGGINSSSRHFDSCDHF